MDLPNHLERRSDLSGTLVYDLKFDYDFRRVPQTYGDSQMRIDCSKEEGYWDVVVDRPGQTKKKKCHLEEVRRIRRDGSKKNGEKYTTKGACLAMNCIEMVWQRCHCLFG